jgi:RNA-binding protein YhbY
LATISQVQLGKQGITENFISTLKNHFKNHEIVKVSILKNAGHDKDKVKDYTEKILGALGKKFTAKTIGFTIIIRKWKKKMR